MHRWLDSALPGAMPKPIRDHIQTCSDCHLFLKQWNAIEVGLVSMRTQTPAVSASFASGLDQRLEGVSQGSAILAAFRRLAPPRQVRLVLAGGTLALLAILCYMVGANLIARISPAASANMAANNQFRRTEPEPPIPAQIQITPR
jgi:hypothetical protein